MQWPQLQCLNLCNKCVNPAQNTIGEMSLKLLTKAEIPMLEILGLGGCFIGNEGVKNIVKGKWPKLK
jgi:hypothetical protein